MGTLGWNLPRHEHDAGADTREERGHLPGSSPGSPGSMAQSMPESQIVSSGSGRTEPSCSS